VKRFSDLTEQEILALAISLEEEDARIYADYAKGLEDNYPASAKVFAEMSR
jgi:rubrerythrin